MKTLYVALLIAAVAMLAKDSTAEQDAGPQKIVIPPMVDKAELPKFDAEPFPTEKSKAPKLDEWKESPLVRLSRATLGSSLCDVKRVREWMKIHCDRRTAGLRMLAGSSDGVALWVPEPILGSEASSPFDTMGRYGEIQFPVRPGDRRIFEFIDLDFGEWDGWGTQSVILVEEQWLEGAKGPEIVMYRR